MQQNNQSGQIVNRENCYYSEIPTCPMKQQNMNLLKGAQEILKEFFFLFSSLNYEDFSMS